MSLRHCPSATRWQLLFRDPPAPCCVRGIQVWWLSTLWLPALCQAAIPGRPKLCNARLPLGLWPGAPSGTRGHVQKRFGGFECHPAAKDVPRCGLGLCNVARCWRQRKQRDRQQDEVWCPQHPVLLLGHEHSTQCSSWGADTAPSASRWQHLLPSASQELQGLQDLKRDVEPLIWVRNTELGISTPRSFCSVCPAFLGSYHEV